MPIYEYECLRCKKNHEVMQKITENPLTKCPACGGRLKKMVSNTSFILKGTGWYVTDYASDRRKSETKDSDTKTEKTAEPKTEQKKEISAEKKSESKEVAVSK